MRRLILIALLFFASRCFAQNVAALEGFCDQGARQASTSGMQSTNYLLGQVPGCTVTVYLTGTTTLATIYSNSSLGTLTNPFKLAWNSSQWMFYAAINQGYDIVLSGGTPPNTYSPPVTLTDQFPGTNINLDAFGCTGSSGSINCTGTITSGTVDTTTLNVTGTSTLGSIESSSLTGDDIDILEGVGLYILSETQFQYNGNTYWNAGVIYNSPFLWDWSQAVVNWPQYFTAAEILDEVRLFIDNPNSNGEFPFEMTDTGGITTYYSGYDNGHYHAVGETMTSAPLMELAYYQKSGSIAAFTTDATALKNGLAAIPFNSTTHLVTITAGNEWVPWGEEEMARFTGDVTWGSVAYWQACEALVTLFTAEGDSTDAATYTTLANQIQTALNSTSSELWDPTDGMFYSATGNNRQVDIYGSAYAVWSGLVTNSAMKTAISNYLVSNYGTLTYEGYYRLTNGNWDCSGYIPSSGASGCGQIDPGTYQNGYWATANRWILETMYLTSSSTAVSYVNDFINGSDMTQEYWSYPSGSTHGNTGMIISWAGDLGFVLNHESLFSEASQGTSGEITCQNGNYGLLACTSIGGGTISGGNSQAPALYVGAENGGNVAWFGQITTTNPKQLVIYNNPTNNVVALQGVQQNVGENQTLLLQSEGGSTVIGDIGSYTSPLVSGVTLNVASETTGVVASFGQIVTSNPKQLTLTNVPDGNLFYWQAGQNGISNSNEAVFFGPYGGDWVFGASGVAEPLNSSPLSVSNETGGTLGTTSGNIAIFGQITTTNPKQLVIAATPSSNIIAIQAEQYGVGYNQTLQLQPLGGTVTAPTPSTSDNSTNVATTAFVKSSSTTVNGVTCTIGGSCTITASSTGITVGTTTIGSGTSGYILYDNAGVLGNVATTGSGSVVEATSPSISGLTVTSSFTATGLVTLADLATQATNTVLGNATSSTASPTALAMPSCSSTGSALYWTSNSGFGCLTSIDLLGTAQTISATKTFSVAPILSSLTGYVYANGSSAVTASTTIPNAGLANSSITIGTTSISLGGTSTSLAGLTGINGITTLYGSGNTLSVGLLSLTSSSTGTNNTSFGASNLTSNTTGSYNSAFGSNSLTSNTTGGDNSAFGLASLQYNTTGSNNVAIGYAAVGNNTAFTNLNDGVYIGFTAEPLSNSDTNEIVIGYVTAGNGSNTVTIGNAYITNTYLRGAVSAKNFAGNSTPTFSVGAAAGTGATATCNTSVVCTDFSGTILVSTGTSTTTGYLVTVTFSSARTNIPTCTGNLYEPAVTNSNVTTWYPGTTTSAYAIYMNSSPAASASYYLFYVCGGN